MVSMHNKSGFRFKDPKSACFQDFVPDQRIKLWCFQAERAIGKETEQRNQGLVKTGVIEWDPSWGGIKQCNKCGWYFCQRDFRVCIYIDL